MRSLPHILFACLLAWASWSPLPAQGLTSDLLDDLPEVPRALRGVYAGISGGMLALTDGDSGTRHLYAHDGEAWHQSAVLQGDEVLHATPVGRLILVEGNRLVGFRTRFRAPAVRELFGRVPTGETVATVALLRSESDHDDDATLFVETDGGVYVCREGRCLNANVPGGRLLGVDGARAFVRSANGDLHMIANPAAGEAHRIPGTELPFGDSFTPFGTTADGELVFRAGTYAYALPVRGTLGSATPRRLCGVTPETNALVVGDALVLLTDGTPLRAVSIPDAGEGAERVIAPGDRDLGLVGVGGFSLGGHAVVRTSRGLVGLESVVTRSLPVQIDPTVGAALGAGDATVLVGQPAGITRARLEPSGRTRPLTHWATADHLMRSSVPTCLAEYDGATVVGTSDGRILRLRADQRTETIVSVLGYGTTFNDLYVDRTGLWAVYTPSASSHSGLLRVRPNDPAPPVIGADDGGISGAVARVRRAPNGALYAATMSSTSPLLIYREHAGDWVSLPGKLPGADHAAVLVRDIAPVSDEEVYLATSRGLLRWRPDGGYELIPLPRGLIDADVRSVLPAAGGIWLTIFGEGVYFYRGGDLYAIGAEANARAYDYRPGALFTLPTGEVALRHGGTLLRFTPPVPNHTPLRPGLFLSAHASPGYATRPDGRLPFSFWEGDSLYVDFGLTGVPTADLLASFALDDAPLRPARVAEGRAVFAPLRPGPHQLTVRITTTGRSHNATVHVQPLHVMRNWYTTPFGIAFAIGVSVIAALAIGSVYTLQQRRLAKELEITVGERTRDLRIAERKAHRASAAKSRFLANMSHEIRTPLNAVLGMSDLLLASPLDEEQAGYASAIRTGGATLHGIVGDILAFAQIDSGSVRRHDADTELHRLCYARAAEYGERAARSGLRFRTEIDVPRQARLDAEKAEAILGHLLDNAIKFTPEGAIVFRAAVASSPAPALCIDVEDTGVGIDVTQSARLFEVFEQGDNSNTRRFGGAGLGLAIVKTYVECLGGTVGVEARPLGGTRFSVRLPIEVLSTDRSPDRVFGVSVHTNDATLAEQFSQLTGTTSGLRPAGDDTEIVPALFVHGYTDAPSLEAFRQNPQYANTLAQGGAVVIVRHWPDHRAFEPGDGERVLAYPFDPVELVQIAEAARRRRKPVSAPRIEVTAANGSSGSTGASGAGSAAPAPAATVPGGSARLAPAPAPAKPTFFDLAAEHPLRILVAEDNPMNKMLILTVLTKLGYKADWAGDGRACVDRFAAGDYDLILMDVHMPEMDGLEATREIRARFEERPVAICALTANASEEGRDECLAAGMDDFITKPLQVPKLLPVLRATRPIAEKARVGAGAAVESAAVAAV